MKSAGKARNNGLYRHIRTSKEIIRNLLNDYMKYIYIYSRGFLEFLNFRQMKGKIGKIHKTQKAPDGTQAVGSFLS